MIYKLNYKDKENAIADLLKKEVYIYNENKELVYGKEIDAIVEIGKIVLEQGIYDKNFKEIKEPIYSDGYAFDIMTNIDIKFESEIFPKTPVHTFAGYEIENKENIYKNEL
jgi:hypothetical protein